MTEPTEGAAGPAVRVHVEGAVGWITLAHPGRMNALAGGMRDDLADALRALGERRDVRVVVITGEGGAFCSGADLSVTTRMLEAGDDEGFATLVEAGMRVVKTLRAIPQPVIAAVHGAAAGAGASLALACDIRIASERASIGFTFNRIGLHPDWGATYFLPRLVGLGRATELVMSGRMLGAEEAHAIGIFQKVVPVEIFERHAHEYAAELAARAPLALSLAKETLSRSLEADLDSVLDAEARAQLRCFRSGDVREGVAAFHDKRQPRFRGE